MFPVGGTSSDRIPSMGLAVLSGAIAAAVLFPLTWLLIEVVTVDPERSRSLLTDPGTLDVLFNSIELTVGVTAGAVLLGVPLAMLTARTDLPFRRFWTILVALPLVVPSYIGAFAFVSAFGPQGEFHDLLEPVGVDHIPEIYGLPGAILVITLYTYPYVFLTTRAALLALDTRQVEAARTLDQGRLAAFRRITLPQIRPAVAAGGLLTALYAISDFGTPAIMRLPVFTRQIFVEYHAFNSEYAVLLSVQLLAVVLVVIALEWLIRPRETIHGDGAGERRSIISLGRWRWAATVFPATVASVALVVPVWILTLWVRRSSVGYQPSLAFEWSHAVNSIAVSSATAVVAALAALPIAYYAARHGSLLSTVFERASYVGFAVPGIVLALALVYYGSGYAPWLYQTIPLLIFAYVVRFLPQSVGSSRTALLQVDPALVEAGRTLGRGPWEPIGESPCHWSGPGSSREQHWSS
ncbi:MAG: iron ABC transporter permease [Natrialbaceae archaeon]|nr:iron ABC transporter permease [Natrialbaceae archaeon]